MLSIWKQWPAMATVVQQNSKLLPESTSMLSPFYAGKSGLDATECWPLPGLEKSRAGGNLGLNSILTYAMEITNHQRRKGK
jgi:hypothetical protein